MDLYILGIGGTFMGHLALLARQLGLRVSGCDVNVYSPMKEMLQANGIEYDEGYDPCYLSEHHRVYVIGNAIGRTNPMIEVLLNQQRPMISGPQWLYEHVLRDKWVIAVAGTHGKTTTTSMIAWILESLGRKPGYLIGGAAKGFAQAASLGDSNIFVIEADEYDTAFFDKRSKFIHYRPKTLILNNLEFDHADIFDTLVDIQKTMHHLVRIVPSEGRIIFPKDNINLEQVLQMGCWSEQFPIALGADEPLKKPLSSAAKPSVSARLVASSLKLDSSEASLTSHSVDAATPDVQMVLKWGLIGEHNLANGLAALAAVEHLGIGLAEAIDALSRFPGVARRMELKFQFDHIRVYDDFAHHPTAIALSLAGLRAKIGKAPLIAFVELRSNTMCMGVHQNSLIEALAAADAVFWLKSPKLSFDLEALCKDHPQHAIFDDAGAMLNAAMAYSQKQKHKPSLAEHWLCMSNGAFGGLFQIMSSMQTKQNNGSF